MGPPDRGEGGLDALVGPVLAHQGEQVDRAGIAGIGAEIDQSAAVCIGDAFIVDECVAAVDDALQQRHVVGLAFDGVREKEVHFVGDDLVDRNLLDPEDDVAGRHAVAGGRARGQVLRRVENAFVGSLHESARTGFADHGGQVGRHQRCAPFPTVFILGADQDGFHVATSIEL